MSKRDANNMKALLGRFFGAEEAQTAAEEIRCADQMFEAYPTPGPSPQVLKRIRAQMEARLLRKRRLARIYRFVGAAAAVFIVGIVGLFGHAPQRTESINRAGLIPTAIWESDDIASDDAELAYLNSEISRIETQIEALRSGEEDYTGTNTLAELEIELRLLETQFWKE